MEQNEHYQPGDSLFHEDQSPAGISGSRSEPIIAPSSLLPAILRGVGEYQKGSLALFSWNEQLAALRSHHWERRAAALNMLARSGTTEVLPWLMNALQDEHPMVRATAVRALGAIGHLAPLDALFAALGDSAWQVREMAVLALAQVRQRGRSVPMELLLRALDDEDWMVREAAAMVLRQEQPGTVQEEITQVGGMSREQAREWSDESYRWPERQERPRMSRRRLLASVGLGAAGTITLGAVASYLFVSRPHPQNPKPPSKPGVTAISGVTQPTDPYRQWTQSHGVMFGFDSQHSGFNPVETRLHTGNVASLAQLWFSQDVPGNYFSSPVISSDTLYVGSVDGRLYAFEAATGQKRWATSAFSTSSLLNNESTPAVFNDRVYICLQDRRLHAFDTSQGRLQWSSPAGYEILYSPTVIGGTVYSSGLGRVYAFEARSGRLLWVSPAVAESDSSSSPVALANNLVYVCLSKSAIGQVYAFDIATGAFKWASEPLVGGLDTNSSPTVTSEMAYIGAANGGLAAFDAHTGRRRWVTPATTGSTGGSPALADGVVYFPNDHISAFNAQTGRRLWVTPAIGAYNGDSPLVANGVLYVCSAGSNSVYALDIKNGQILWTSPPARGQIFTTPAVANGVVYTAAEDGTLFAFALPRSQS